MRNRLPVLGLAALALVATGCITLDPPPGPAPLRYRDEVFTNVTKTSDVTYGSAPDYQGQTVTLKLDVYAPTGDTITNRPAIVWVHGGGFSGGNKSSPEIVDEANTFAKKGYVNVSIDYRLRPTGCLNNPPPGSCIAAVTDAMHDAQAAVRFLRANRTTYGVDGGRIGIGGSSAGAVTALNVGFNPDNPGTSGNPGFSSAVRGAVSISGGKLVGTAGQGDAASLLFHSTEDPLVPYPLAANTVKEARAAGLTSFLVTWEGSGHVPYGQHRSEILAKTTNFLYGALDLTNAAR
jgi:dipeptidyl aminopeptidase/acylaminoacyl peptidase